MAEDGFSLTAGTLDTSPDAVTKPVPYAPQPLVKAEVPPHELKLPGMVDLPPADPEKAKAAIRKAEQASADISAGEAGRIERLRQANDHTLDQIMERQSGELGNLSKEWNASAELAKREPNLWDKFGSPAFVVAMLGSAFSAQPMNAALTAGGAAMQAMNEGSWADYKAHFEAWKENSKLAIERSKLEHQMYSEILEKQTHDMSAFNAQARAALASVGHKSALALLDAGMLPEFNQAIEGHNKATLEAEKARIEVIKNESVRQYIENSEEYKRGDAAGVIARLVEVQQDLAAAKGSKNPITRVEAEKYKEEITRDPRNYYNKSPTDQGKIHAALTHYFPEFNLPDRPGMTDKPPGMSDAVWDAEADLKNLDPTYNPFRGYGKESAAYTAALNNHAVERAVANNQTGGDILANRDKVKAEGASLNKLVMTYNNISAFGRFALRNGEVLARLANKTDTNKVPVWQRWERNGRQALKGDEDVTNFNALIIPYRDEIARIVTNPVLTGGGLSVHAQKEGKAFADSSMTGEQIYGINTLFKGEFERREQELNDQILDVQATIAGKIYNRPERPPDMPPSLEDRSGYKVEFN